MRPSVTVLVLVTLACGLAPGVLSSLISAGEVSCTMPCANTDSCCCKPRTAVGDSRLPGPILAPRVNLCREACATLRAATRTLPKGTSIGFRATVPTVHVARTIRDESTPMPRPLRIEDAGPRGPPLLLLVTL